MTQKHTATLTMRRSLETIGNTGTTETENLQFETLILNEVINDAQWVAHSLEEGEPVDVSSFRDAVAAAYLFYGRQGPSRITPYDAGSPGLKTDGSANKEEAQPQVKVSEPRGKTRHPLVAWVLGTIGIMWFAIRHPGEPAWIDHRTGAVWVAE